MHSMLLMIVVACIAIWVWQNSGGGDPPAAA